MFVIEKLKVVRRGLQFQYFYGRQIKKAHRRNIRLYVCANSAVHGNMGDQALGYCRRTFLYSIGIPDENIIEYTSRDKMRYWPQICNAHTKSDIILLRGGGYWGDLWLDGFQEILQYIGIFRDNPIIVFPQSVFFSDTETGKRWLKYSQEIVEKAKNIKIFARDDVSFKRLEAYYPSANIGLAPDTVLSYKPEKINNQNRCGVILCFRNDKERNRNMSIRIDVPELLNKKNIFFQYQDTCIDFNMGTLAERKPKLYELWNKFSSAELVITDRLHGMIFSAITGTPCIVFDNMDGKVGHEYEWIKKLNYIRYLTSMADFEKNMEELRELPKISYPVEMILPYFDDLAKSIFIV